MVSYSRSIATFVVSRSVFDLLTFDDFPLYSFNLVGIGNFGGFGDFGGEDEEVHKESQI